MPHGNTRIVTDFLPARSSIRRNLVAVGILLALTAIAGAVALKPSRRSPDAWDNLKKKIQRRAQVDIFEDFRSGLDSWQNIDNVATWSYDSGGLAIPGKLAILTPTIPLQDYDLDTVAQVVSKGLGIVFRATGMRDHQVAKLLVDGRGPMPPLVIDRYSEVGGKESPHIRIRCPGTFQKDTLYHIHLEVRGDRYTLFIEGQLIDSWSDARTMKGGVGFFCVNGERARVAWLHVSHNDDVPGKVCSYLASLF